MVLLFLFNTMSSNGQIAITSNASGLLPPGTFLTDLAATTTFNVANNSNNDFGEVTFRIHLFSDDGVDIRTNTFLPTERFQINAFASRVFTGIELQTYFDPSNLIFNSEQIQQQVLSTGLPAGNYQICLQAFDDNTNPLSPDEPQGCSNLFNVQAKEVSVTVQVLPPFTPNFQDYSSNSRTKVTLLPNFSGDASLRIHLIGDNNIDIQTLPGFAPFNLVLQANVPLVLTSGDLEPYFETSSLVFQGISATEVLSDGLPAGNYQFCIQVLDSNNQPVSPDEPLGCSNLFNISPTGIPGLSAIDPPIPVSPQCDSTPQATAQNIVFSWTPAPGAPAFTEYTLKIVEILDPEQDPNDAMLSATQPAFFEASITGGYSFFYGPGQPLLEKDRKYAWQVIAQDLETNTPFINNGRSEVCWFLWDPKGAPQLAITAQPALSKGPNKTQGGKLNSITNADPVPISSITGQLHYTFKKTLIDFDLLKTDEGNKNITAAGNTQGMLTASVAKDNLVYNKQHLVADDSQPLAGVKVSLVMYYLLDGTVGNKIYKTQPINSKDMQFKNTFDNQFPGHEQVLATTTTAEDGSFNFQYFNPEKNLGMQDFDLNWTSGGGEFFDKVIGKLYKVIRLKVENEYYCSPDLNIKVQPWEALDLGTVVSYVKSYNLDIYVKTATAEYWANQQIGEGGMSMTEVNTTLYRPWVLPELPKPSTTSGKSKLKIPGSADSLYSVVSDGDGKVRFTNLVRHAKDSEKDRYWIYCKTSKTAGNFNFKPRKHRYDAISIGEDHFPYNQTYLVHHEASPGVIATTETKGYPIIWNSEFEIESFADTVFMYPTAPRIFGQVIVKNATGDSAQQLAAGKFLWLKSDYRNEPKRPFRITKTDQKGHYSFDELDIEVNEQQLAEKPFSQNSNEDEENSGVVIGPQRSLFLLATGYKRYKNDTLLLQLGQQLKLDIPLEPDGYLAGYIVNEMGESVAADVYLGGIKTKTELEWKVAAKEPTGLSEGRTKSNPATSVDNNSVMAGNTSPSMAAGAMTFKHKFSFMVPSGNQQSLIIKPKDPMYFDTTYSVNVAMEELNLGFATIKNPKAQQSKVYVVSKKLKRMKFKVVAGEVPGKTKLKLPGKTATPLSGVVVKLDLPNQPIASTTDANGEVFFEFSNSASSFTFQITPPEDMDYEATPVTFSYVKDSPVYIDYNEVKLHPTFTVSGIVALASSQQPISGAKVYQVKEGGLEIAATTDQNGKYVLKKVVSVEGEFTIGATKTGTSPLLTTEVKTIHMEKGKTQYQQDFILKENKDFYIADLFGFKIQIQDFEKTGNQVIIRKGQLESLPTNGNFKVYDQSSQNAKPAFSNLELIPSGGKTSQGTPIYQPANSKVELDIPELKLKVHDHFGALLEPLNGELVTLDSKEGKGYLAGKVKITPSSFNFTDAYLKTDSDYYLTDLSTPEKNVKTITAYPWSKQSFNIVNAQDDDLTFGYLGFKARADRAKSFLNTDQINLNTTLFTDEITGMTPSIIQLDIGDLIVKTDKIEPISDQQPVKFSLEKWQVTGDQWFIHQSDKAISIPQAVIKTGLLDIPVNNFRILPNDLDASGFEIQNITLAGIAPVTINQPENLMFGFNSSCAKDQKGHWELRNFGMNNQAGAVIKGLPGMEPGDQMPIEVLSLYSNGDQNVIFPTTYSGTLFHKVLKVTPLSFNSGPNYLEIAGNLDLRVPMIQPKTGFLRFVKEASGIKLLTTPLDLTFDGPGGLTFSHSSKFGDQVLNPSDFQAKGTIYDKEGIKLKAKFHRTANDVFIEVDPKGQKLPLGGGSTSLADITGKMETDKNTWKNFVFSGDLQGFKGMSGNTRKTFTVYGSITANDEKLDVKNIPTPFGGMGFTYDIKNSRLTGHMNIDKKLGVMALKGVADILVDAGGWYFLAGGELTTPGLGTTESGLLIGDYHSMPTNVSTTLMQFAYDKHVPPSFQNGISGFFFTGRKDVPIINIPDWSIDLGVVSAGMGVTAGLDARVWMGFDNDNGNEYGIGAMAFAHVYFKLSSWTCTKLSAEARAELGAQGVYNSQNGAFALKGCGSIGVGGRAEQCVPFIKCCVSDACKWCVGGSIYESVKVDLLLDSKGNTDLDFGFGNCSGQGNLTSNW